MDVPETSWMSRRYLQAHGCPGDIMDVPEIILPGQNEVFFRHAHRRWS